MVSAFNELKKKYDNIELVLVEGVKQEEAIEIYGSADIIVDQLNAGTYGVFAIESMALGKPVISYISDEMKLKLPEELPILSANKQTISTVLEYLVTHPFERNEVGIRGRRYVELYYDYRKVAVILRDIYSGKLQPVTGRKAFERVKNVKIDF